MTKSAYARTRVLNIDELSAVSAKAREAGQSVVLAHGVFDLLHLGHVRHLEAARKFGDVLICTVTADKFVNKGPGRPVFPEELRAEMLSSLNCVDWSGINPDSSAEALLEAVKPTYYVKGSDYANADDDITGKIQAEREMVERHGGKLVFTDELTFSSSELINRHFSAHDSEVNAFLEEMREEVSPEKLIALVNKVKDYKVLLIGETILDEYQYVNPMQKSAKENVLAVLYQSRELFAGGVLAAANHLSGFCEQVDVITCIGQDGYEDFVHKHVSKNVNLLLHTHSSRPTIRKRRYVDPVRMQKLFEIYYMDDRPISAERQASIEKQLEDRIDDYDLVIVCDFGHGMLTNGLISKLEERSRFLAINTQSNAANRGFNPVTKYRRADFVCIDEPESRLAVHSKHGDLNDILTKDLPSNIDAEKIFITLGKQGCMAWCRKNGVVHVPAFNTSAVDTMGAGDAFFVVASALTRAGGQLRDVGFIGNIIGGLKASYIGHRQNVEKTATLKSIVSLLK